jgi:hypothetical protein
MSPDQQKIKVPDYDASERQTEFHKTIADEKLYGGAAGGGKTAAIVAESVTLALEYPGIPVNMFRRTIPDLNKTIKREIIQQCGPYIKSGNMTWHGQSNAEHEGRSYVFSNGSSITLNYLDNENDVYHYQGAEMPIIAVDELTQFPQSWIDYLITRNRTGNDEWPVLFMAGTNPGGIGHGWVKKRFIDHKPWGEVFHVSLPDGTTKSRVFIPARLDDHPNERFKKDYNKQLQSIGDPNLRKALREGSWTTFAGQVFVEFDYNIHVIQPFEIPKHWQRWRAMDHGNNNSVGWFAQDPHTERIYMYREYREKEYKEIGVKARNIKQFEAGETIAYGLADPSIWAAGQGSHATGKSIAQLYEDDDVRWMPANNDRKAGLEIVHKKLAIQKDGLPGIQFFSTCSSTITTVPDLPYDKFKVDDVDTKADDHDYDMLRYALMAFVPSVDDDDEITAPGWVKSAMGVR